MIHTTSILDDASLDMEFHAVELIELRSEERAYFTQYDSEMTRSNGVDKELRYNHRD